MSKPQITKLKNGLRVVLEYKNSGDDRAPRNGITALILNISDKETNNIINNKKINCCFREAER